MSSVKDLLAPFVFAAVLLVLAGCGSSEESAPNVGLAEVEGSDVESEAVEPSDAELDEAGPDQTIGGDFESEAGDIETWLIEVGNDFPDGAKCVANEMKSYSVSDFEDSMAGESSEEFETELDAAYEKCEALLGITTEE